MTQTFDQQYTKARAQMEGGEWTLRAEIADLQAELAAVKAENVKLRETAYGAIEYVAIANYHERVVIAHEMMNNVEVAK